MDAQLNLSGNIKQEITGYEAVNLRKKILLDSNKGFPVKSIREYYPEYVVKNVVVENLEKEESPLILEADLFNEKEPKKAEFKISAQISTDYNNRFFSYVIRKCPIDFDYPFLIEYEQNIKIPDDFVAEYPQNVRYEVYGKNALFTYQVVEQKANSFKLKIRIELKISQFPAHEYQNLAEFFTNVSDKLKEGIIIKKGDLN